jgi:hypothetical protein
MSTEINTWIYIILFGQVSVNLLIFILFISSLHSKKSSVEESNALRNEMEQLNSRLSAKETELSEALAQKSESEEELRKVLDDKTSLKQEYEKKLQDPVRHRELEIIREDNKKLNARLSAKEQELSKALAQKAAAEEVFKKVSEDKGTLRQEYDNELQGLVDHKEFLRLQEENQKLNSQVLAKEAELSKISAQKAAVEEVFKKAAEDEASLKREYEKKLQGLVDHKEFLRLQEENQRLNAHLSTKEQELLKTLALKSAIEGAFREISSSRVVLGKEQEEKAKELLGPEILQRFKEEKQRLNTQVLAKEKELVDITAQSSAVQEELKKAKSDFLAEKQKLENLFIQEREKLGAQMKLKEEELARALDQRDKLTDDLRKNMEAMVDKAELKAWQEKFNQLNKEAIAKEKELSKALEHKAKAEETVKQGAEEKASLKQEYEKKLQGLVDRKEFERLREENQKLNAEIIAKEKEFSLALEEKKAAEKKLGKISKDLQLPETPSTKVKSKEQAGQKEVPETDKAGKLKGGAYPKAQGLEPLLPIAGELPQDLIPHLQEQEKKIGDLLKSTGLIEESLWQKAINYQKQHIGSSLIQYLLAYGYLKEDQLAECLCDYFKIPYLPLAKYEIPEEVIKLIPQDIIEKYLVIPVYKSGNIINVVMANPFDVKAIRAIEETTGCKVRPFVGLFSEIISALKVYVRPQSEGSDKYPFFIDTKSYTGLERRESVRIDAALDIEFLAEGGYKRSVTKNVSRDGFCFEAEISLPVGSIFPLMVYLPVHINPLPIKVITKVVKIIPLENNRVEIRLNTIKISKEELNKIIEFATLNKEKQSGRSP